MASPESSDVRSAHIFLAFNIPEMPALRSMSFILSRHSFDKIEELLDKLVAIPASIHSSTLKELLITVPQDISHYLMSAKFSQSCQRLDRALF